MAEVGLVRFAKAALDLAKAGLPDYRSKFFQACLHPAAIIGCPLPHALRGLDPAKVEVD